MDLKPATPEEIEFYEKVLYPAQDKILNAIGKTFGDAFYLTGGTALSRFYFHHRLSEDLDLFTMSKKTLPVLRRRIQKLSYPERVALSKLQMQDENYQMFNRNLIGRNYESLRKEGKLS